MIKAKKPFKVIVIGAGMAGLTAANKLRHHGIETVILEARDRIGGRTWTSHKLGIPFDYGASWIHGMQDNPIAELSQQLKLNTHECDFSNYLLFDRNHHPIAISDIEHFSSEFTQILHQAGAYARRAKQDIDLATALTNIVSTKKRPQLWQDLYKARHMGISLYIGADPNQISAREWDQESILPGGNHILLSGYLPIVEQLAKSCHIELNTQVQHIIYEKNQVTVISNQGSFQANAVIITVPISILKKNLITFTPALPDFKKTALEHLEMGLLNRIALKFPKAFWPNKYQGIRVIPERKTIVPLFVNYHYFMPQPILIGMVSGDAAQQLELLDDTEIIKYTMTGLKRYFGDAIPKPIAYEITRWQHDPFSYGSYSYLPVGSSGVDYQAMAEPVAGCLFFAGEASHQQYPGTTHGAYLSGMREAERIINR